MTKDGSKLSVTARREAMPQSSEIVREYMAEFGLTEVSCEEGDYVFRWRVKETAADICRRNERIANARKEL
jgi:hypothetical protein